MIKEPRPYKRVPNFVKVLVAEQFLEIAAQKMGERGGVRIDPPSAAALLSLSSFSLMRPPWAYGEDF